MTDLKHYLLVYDRRAGRVLSQREFPSQAAAMHARFESERLHRGNADIEIVVLGASSSQDLKRTHARYFNDTDSMYGEALNRISGKGVTKPRPA